MLVRDEGDHCGGRHAYQIRAQALVEAAPALATAPPVSTKKRNKDRNRETLDDLKHIRTGYNHEQQLPLSVSIKIRFGSLRSRVEMCVCLCLRKR